MSVEQIYTSHLDVIYIKIYTFVDFYFYLLIILNFIACNRLW